ncbi:F-box/FBD/LRR-repeat protein At5g56420-like [Chenopodium quinoa]|uniref:F-box/FBD/LRR-repeat protein At5g56420-like n=1 Tax=Chenopodium quinoa TaxID=63459 RepID=UPI000B797DAF|nr:F-box/FBD/LRR-repeat protein At5g56420-like [Chenopodium quinoa]
MRGLFGCLNRDMSDGTSSIDRISELPDFILHHILSYLSTKEAAQTGVISKRWRYVWETFPILDCNEWFFGRELDILNPKELGIPKDERRKIFNQRLKFMSYVDEKLRRFRDENLCVKKFFLHITLVSNDLTPRVDTWMYLVADLCIQELDLYITMGRERLYDLSKKLLTMESLTILTLRGCLLLSSRLDRNAVKLCSLVELLLRDVSIDEGTIQDLIFSIHSMKVFTLLNCLGFENLEICDHDKLEKMVYHPHKDFKAKKLSIKVQTLKEVDFCSVDEEKRACEIIVSSVCQNLKRLSLCGIPIDAKWLQSMIPSFPLLEHLFLGGCILQEVMKLSSQALTEMHVCNCKKLVEAEFDTPNVHSFVYRGKTMPRLYLSSFAAYRTAELSVRLENMDSLWLMRLNNFLKDNKFQDLTFCMTAKSDKAISFNVEDYVGIQFSPLELNIMKLVTHTLTSVNYAALLDALFWNLRPRILSLELNYYSPEFLKGILKGLLAKEEPSCYCSQNLECWRHSLKDIKLITVKGLKSNIVFNAITLNKLINFLDDWVIEAQKTVKSCEYLKVETLSFQLSWQYTNIVQ